MRIYKLVIIKTAFYLLLDSIISVIILMLLLLLLGDRQCKEVCCDNMPYLRIYSNICGNRLYLR